MGKIINRLFILSLSLILLNSLYAKENSISIETLEKNSLMQIQDYASILTENGNGLQFNILEFSLDDSLFYPQILVKSDVICKNANTSVRRNIYFIVDDKELIIEGFYQNLQRILPSIMNSLYGYEDEPLRLFYTEDAPLSAKKDPSLSHFGPLVVTRDSENKATSLLLIERDDDEYLYLRSLWAKDSFVEYQKLFQGPLKRISFSIPSNFHSLGFSSMYQISSLFNLLHANIGIKTSYDFLFSRFSLLAQGGLDGFLPATLFLFPQNDSKWFAHLSLVVRGDIAIGVSLAQDFQLMYQSSTTLGLNYQLNESLSISLGGAIEHSTYMEPSDIFAVDFQQTQYNIVMDFSLLW